jgi:mRNA interferase RelE/StbE
VSSPYDVRISARAERDLLRLPEKIGAACLAFIFGPMSEQPYRVGGALRGQLVGLRSARRGNYRILYRIEDEDRRIDIVHIDHRGGVYRRPSHPSSPEAMGARGT